MADITHAVDVSKTATAIMGKVLAEQVPEGLAPTFNLTPEQVSYVRGLIGTAAAEGYQFGLDKAAGIRSSIHDKAGN